jgi:hypothetical protein
MFHSGAGSFLFLIWMQGKKKSIMGFIISTLHSLNPVQAQITMQSLLFNHQALLSGLAATFDLF